MTSGRVVRTPSGGLQPWLAISVERPDGELRQCDFILDTGFTGSLVLPESVIAEMGLIRLGSETVVLGSGEEHSFDYYVARIIWQGQLRRTDIYRSIGQPLLGMELLEGAQVAVDAWEDGAVTVTFS